MQQKPRYEYPKYFRKKMEQLHPLLSYKYLKCVIFTSNNVYFAHKFCAISFSRSRDITIPKFWKICYCSASYPGMPSKLMSKLSSKLSILHTKFCTIPCNRIRDRTIIKSLEKMRQQCLLDSYFYPNCIIVISNNTYFVYKFLCIFI